MNTGCAIMRAVARHSLRTILDSLQDGERLGTRRLNDRRAQHQFYGIRLAVRSSFRGVERCWFSWRWMVCGQGAA
jgi:hypothetical protein